MSRPRSWVTDEERLRSFWALFLLRSGERRYSQGNKFSRWRALGQDGLIVAHYVTDHSVGVFLRGPRGEKLANTRTRLGVDLDRLADALAIEPGGDFLLVHHWPTDTADPSLWPALAGWMHAAGDRVINVAAQLRRAA